MENELQAVTPAGRQLVARAGRFAEAFAPAAARYDREGAFPYEHLEALRDDGFLYAPAPAEAGGLGVESAHDLMVASSRVSRGDPSLMLGANMHWIVFHTFARQRRVALNRGDERRVEAVTANMRRLVAEKAFIAAAVSEGDQDLLRPKTTVTYDGATWRLNGRKIISSGAPAATHFTVAARADLEGEERYLYAFVPREAPGVTVLDDWDALGMRASASCTVVFEDVELPGFYPGKGAPAGVITAQYLEETLISGPAHAAAALGVAEAAHAASVAAVERKRLRAPGEPVRPFVQERAAENSIDLAATRAVFSRSLLMVDEYHATHPAERGTLAEVGPVFAEVQRAKAFINAAAVRIADRAMAMAGGAGYMNGAPLARAYRDARAGAFMHPLGANVAMDYLGSQALGLQPERL